MIPGEIIPAAGDIELNAGRAVIEIEVANAGDRPVQVGSHYHFAETNPLLRFDRTAARGRRPIVFTNLKDNKGVAGIADFVLRQGGITP